MSHWLYFTSNTGTIHLADFDLVESGSSTTTLCGQPTGQLVGGDETVSGIIATCGRCRRIARLGPMPRQ